MSFNSTATPRLAGVTEDRIHRLGEDPMAAEPSHVSISVVSTGDSAGQFIVRIEPWKYRMSMPPLPPTLQSSLNDICEKHQDDLRTGAATDDANKAWAQAVKDKVEQETRSDGGTLYTVETVEYRDSQGFYQEL